MTRENWVDRYCARALSLDFCPFEGGVYDRVCEYRLVIE